MFRVCDETIDAKCVYEAEKCVLQIGEREEMSSDCNAVFRSKNSVGGIRHHDSMIDLVRNTTRK